MIELKVRVQNIYYQTNDDRLAIARATSDKRISLAEAEVVLQERKIEFKDILKIKIEYVQLAIDLNILEDFIVPTK